MANIGFIISDVIISIIKYRHTERKKNKWKTNKNYIVSRVSYTLEWSLYWYECCVSVSLDKLTVYWLYRKLVSHFLCDKRFQFLSNVWFSFLCQIFRKKNHYIHFRCDLIWSNTNFWRYVRHTTRPFSHWTY